MFKLIWQNKTLKTLVLLLVILGVRIYGLTLPAQPYDIGTYHAWGQQLLNVGPSSFFGSIWSDYMPLPILTFALPALVSHLTLLDFTLVFKLFHTIIELGLLYLIYRFCRTSSKSSWLFAILFLAPATIADTSFWGQVDAIPSLLTLLSLVILTQPAKNNASKHGLLSATLYGLAVAYKPIMILAAPLMWVLSLRKLKFWQFPLLSGLIFFSTALPFVQNFWQLGTFMWSRVINQASTYPYLSINGWNIWTLVPTNIWIPDSTTVLGISGHTFGLVLFGLSTLLTLVRFYHRGLRKSDAAHVIALIFIAFYTFTTRMHERHLLFGLPFLAYAATIDKSLLKYYLGLTIFYLLNLYSAFYWVTHNQTWPLPADVTSLCSWGVVLTTIILVIHYLRPQFISDLRHVVFNNRSLSLILILASLLRFVNLAHPPAYIFDEVYHAFTAKEYLHNHVEAWEWWTTPPKGVAYEWTHPPVAKYGMVGGMLLFGENEFGYRVGSAFFGVLSIFALYLLTHSLTGNKNLALLSAFILSIEGTHIAQSRIAMNDIYMLCFLLFSLFAATKSRWKLAAVLYGLSLGSKWSALYGVVPLGLIYFHNQLTPFKISHKLLSRFLSIFRYLLIVLAVYLLSFTPFILAGHTWSQWWELQRQMWYYHTQLVATHAYQSTPKEWVFDARPVWYWVDYGKDVISNIYVVGNPLILWLGLLALLLQLPLVTSYPYLILYVLYGIFTIPWIFSPRIMFYYHYLPSATFLTVILTRYMLSLSRVWRNTLITLCVLGFVLIIPMLYGIPLSTHFWDLYFKLFPTWK